MLSPCALCLPKGKYLDYDKDFSLLIQKDKPKLTLGWDGGGGEVKESKSGGEKLLPLVIWYFYDGKEKFFMFFRFFSLLAPLRGILIPPPASSWSYNLFWDRHW